MKARITDKGKIEALRAEVERLRAALEEIADVAHPPDMHAANIARRALGRGRGSDG